MSDRISEILDVISDVAKRYQSYMSEGQVTTLRIDASARVAQHRSILASTVSSKYRRELQPAIKDTQGFDRALFAYLDSGDTALRSALEQKAAVSDLAQIRDVFGASFVDLESLDKQVADDLESFKEEEGVLEGGRKERLLSYFERDPKLRADAIKIHGTSCIACGFNFEAAYGVRGKNYIEVHHIVPISTLPEPSTIDPRNDLTVLCSNCHRMVHRKRDNPLSIDELVKVIAENRHGASDMCPTRE